MLESQETGTHREILSKLSLLFSLSFPSLSLSSIYPSLDGLQCLRYSLIFSLTENALTPDFSKLHIID